MILPMNVGKYKKKKEKETFEAKKQIFITHLYVFISCAKLNYDY